MVKSVENTFFSHFGLSQWPSWLPLPTHVYLVYYASIPETITNGQLLILTFTLHQGSDSSLILHWVTFLSALTPDLFKLSHHRGHSPTSLGISLMCDTGIASWWCIHSRHKVWVSLCSVGQIKREAKKKKQRDDIVLNIVFKSEFSWKEILLAEISLFVLSL